MSGYQSALYYQNKSVPKHDDGSAIISSQMAYTKLDEISSQWYTPHSLPTNLRPLLTEVLSR